MKLLFKNFSNNFQQTHLKSLKIIGTFIAIDGCNNSRVKGQEYKYS